MNQTHPTHVRACYSSWCKVPLGKLCNATGELYWFFAPPANLTPWRCKQASPLFSVFHTSNLLNASHWSIGLACRVVASGGWINVKACLVRSSFIQLLWVENAFEAKKNTWGEQEGLPSRIMKREKKQKQNERLLWMCRWHYATWLYLNIACLKAMLWRNFSIKGSAFFISLTFTHGIRPWDTEVVAFMLLDTATATGKSRSRYILVKQWLGVSMSHR